MKKRGLILGVFVMVALSTAFVSCKPDDQKVQTAVETALSTIAGQENVSISIKDGVATLTGSVASDEAKLAAMTAAKSVKDVKDVVNNLVVNTPVAPVLINPDETLQSVLSTSLSTAGFKDVSIAVKNGEVTLTGNVKKADLQKVMQFANEAKPKKVINQLIVK